MISNNTIIPSIRKYKYFEKALSCQSEYVLLSEANIGNLQSLIGKCHQSGKKVLVHLELLGGFKPDQAGINLLKIITRLMVLFLPISPRYATPKRGIADRISGFTYRFAIA